MSAGTRSDAPADRSEVWLAELVARLTGRDPLTRIGVVGLGYVGLPAACLFAEAGFQVTGIELDPERHAAIAAGRSPFEGDEPGLAELLARVRASQRLAVPEAPGCHVALSNCDVVLFAIQTPLGEGRVPDYVHLRAALAATIPHLRPGALLIVESTLSPGTIERVIRPMFEAAGKVVGRDVLLGHCPERVMPGKLLSNMRSLPRVCGGTTPGASRAMSALYRAIVSAELTETDATTAEIVKTAENAYRDVNIAFANELAKVCEAAGADFEEVRALVNLSPGRNVLLPGTGVGGHCIPKDPWLLAAAAPDALVLVPAARAVNDGMPAHVAHLVERALAEAGISLARARVCVCGWAYLEGSDDTRNSPSEALVQILGERGAEVRIHDPYVAQHQGDLYARAEGCDTLVLAVAHPAYRALDLAALRARMRHAIVVDGRRVLDAAAARAAGFTYRAVGLGR